MTRREAALILGIREHAKEDIIKEAHRKIMIANHPDAGESFEPRLREWFPNPVDLQYYKVLLAQKQTSGFLGLNYA